MLNHINSSATYPPESIHDTSPDSVSQAGLRYLAAGLGLVPIAADGRCRPDCRLLPEVWDPEDGRWRRSWQGYRPTLADLDKWQLIAPYGLAVACGAASGGLEALHFRAVSTFTTWRERVQDTLVTRCPMILTPRGGMQILYRCLEYGRSHWLTRSDQGECLVEVQGEGMYVIVPPSPGSCHPSGRPGWLVHGSPDIRAVPQITPAERQELWDAAPSS